MAERAVNEGFRMLDDFVCEAIHDPAVPRAADAHQGQNEGMRVVEELVFDVPAGKSKQEAIDDSEMRRIAEKLATLIASQSDPAGAMARFQQELQTQIIATPDRAHN
jgi:hypothetical protein